MFLEEVADTASKISYDFSSIDFSAIPETYVTVVGIAIPTVVALMAIRKGIGSLLGMIRKA